LARFLSGANGWESQAHCAPPTSPAPGSTIATPAKEPAEGHSSQGTNMKNNGKQILLG